MAFCLDNIPVTQVEAQNIPLMLGDCSLMVINGNYALSAGVVDRCLVTEDKDSDIAKKMANVIMVKNGQEDNEKTRVLLKALKQENIATFIKAKFGDSVIHMV